MIGVDPEEIGKKVRGFYEEFPFPGYEEFETPHDLIEKASKGIYAKFLDEQLPLGVRVLDSGCGTGQLAIFLSLSYRKVFGMDFSHNSLRKGSDFTKRFNLGDVHFFQMDIFHVGLKEEVFDYIFCNGVLHHTADAYAGFRSLCRLLKRGGYITLGIYNTYGRILLDLRRFMFRFTGDRIRWLDGFMRQQSLGEKKKQVWFMDQYKNPHEERFTVDEALGWFDENHIEYVNSIPKINRAERFTMEEKLFGDHDRGTRLGHLLSQLTWIFTQGREGGFFILIGRKSM
ncbi:MAG: class I SAM-dependent methyltransferase [Deltaproteobacteria bacterium]|nr:class I SAM-dependent methyltransferase [Deltaproteobacteria bacterium]